MTQHALKIASREQIVETAARLFADRGYAAVSMRDVARAVSMTPAALYHHFDGKDDLYKDVLLDVFSDKAERIRAIAAGDGSSLKKFEGLLIWFAKLLTDEPIFARLLRRELLDGDSDRMEFIVRSLFQGMLNDILSFVGEAKLRIDPGLFALSALSLVFGYNEISSMRQHLCGAQVRDEEPERFARKITSLLLYGAASPQKQEP